MKTHHTIKPVLARALPILALTLLAGVATADLPTESQNIWAPTGDIVGTENHLTGTFLSADRHGDPAKAGEDWQLMDKAAGEGLFGWHKTWDSDYTMSVRGLANSGAGGLNSQFLIGGTKPGQLTYSIQFRSADHHYDQNSEMRSPTFPAPPAPPELGAIPTLRWKMANMDLNYRFSDAVSLKLGLDRHCREGFKGSLLRSGIGDAAPGTKYYDTTRNTFRLGLDYAREKFSSDIVFAYRMVDGDRTLDTRQIHTDDQKQWSVRVGADYKVDKTTTFQGHFMTSRLENTGKEVRVSESISDSEVKTYAGQLGLNSRMGRHWTVRLAGDFRQVRTNASQNDDTGVLFGAHHDRESQDFQAQTVYSGLKNTRLQLGYRYRNAKLEDAVASDAWPGGGQDQWQTEDQDKQDHRIDFRGRHRFSRKTRLDLRLGWQQQDVQTMHDSNVPTSPWFYTMGDRKITRFNSKLMVKTRPAKTLRMDLGYQGFSRCFERTDLYGVESRWKVHRGLLNLNWAAHEKVTFYGMVSYGLEKYELNNDPVTSPGMGSVLYDGTTLRFMPGVNVQVTPAFNLEAMYEGIRFCDKGNESDTLNKIEADHDRILARARYTFAEKYAAAVTYQRREFFEHRWDNYIHDLYSVSVSGRF